LAERRLVNETVRRMINTLVTDLIAETEKNIAASGVQNLNDVRTAPPLAAFSPAVQEKNRELKSFLYKNLYRHYHVMRMSAKAHRIIRELFQAFMDDERLLPPQYQRTGEQRPRVVADYIAGMTDRYAIREHRRIFAVEETQIW
jgi:dGTPase